MFGWKRNVLFLIVLQLALGLVCLNCVPRTYVDELWDSSLGYNLATTGSLSHPFIEGFGGIHINFVQTRILLPVVTAAIFSVTNYSVAASRFGSVLFAILAVTSLYAVMNRWFGSRQAFLASLAMMIHPWFFEVSRRARPEIFYLALGLLFLWILVVFFDTGSRKSALFVGIAAGLSCLSHPNGFILVFAVGCAVVMWRECRLLGRLAAWATVGFVIIVLPYIVYLFFALQNPQVDFVTQMQMGLLRDLSLAREISRWKGFLKWPLGAGFALIMMLSWAAAWYKSKPEDKILATSVLLFVIILPFVSVSQASRYLSVTIPFCSALGVRFLWRIWAGQFPKKPFYKLRAAAVSVLVIIYVSTAVPATGLMFYRLHNARFDESLSRIASVVGPGSRVCGDPILWLGHEKYQYGPWWLFDSKISLKEAINWGREHNFDYAVRTAWRVVDFRGIDEPPMEMPVFRENYIFDCFCFLFGTKVDEFRDPYFGPIEIYKLNWDKYNWPEYYKARRQALQQK